MMREQFWSYAWLGLAAWCGVLARAARWTTPEGRFDWRKALFECASAPAIGVITAGIGRYLSPDMDPIILNAIAALFGLLGPAALETMFTKWVDRRIGL